MLGADGAHAGLIVADRDGGLLAMDGHETFKQAVRRLAQATLDACDAAGVALDDVDLFVYHQANTRILAALAERLGIDPARVVDASHARQHVGRERAACARAGARRRAARARHAGRARGRGVRVHVGRGGRRVGARVTPPDWACALVTGGSRGIGAAVCRALAADGWPVAVNYRSGAEEARRRRRVDRGGRRPRGGARTATSPIRPPRSRCSTRPREALGGPVLVLVNNAGVRADGLALSLTDEDWQRVLDTNLGATYRLTRAALRAMIRARFGRVINIASVVGPRANAGQANYAASKAAVIAFSKTAAVEVARRGVTINAVAPGLIATDMTGGRPRGVRERVPAQRSGTPEEVAAAVAFLASDARGLHHRQHRIRRRRPLRLIATKGTPWPTHT